MKESIGKTLTALCGAALSWVTGLPPLLWVLLCVMSLDYLTGLLCGAMGVSEKTPQGGLQSGAAVRGLVKKGVILLVILLSALVDHAVSLSAAPGFCAVSGAACLWFIAGEGISILENAVLLGVPVPRTLRAALEMMKSKGDSDPTESH